MLGTPLQGDILLTAYIIFFCLTFYNNHVNQSNARKKAHQQTKNHSTPCHSNYDVRGLTLLRKTKKKIPGPYHTKQFVMEYVNYELTSSGRVDDKMVQRKTCQCVYWEVCTVKVMTSNCNLIEIYVNVKYNSSVVHNSEYS